VQLANLEQLRRVSEKLLTLAMVAVRAVISCDVGQELALSTRWRRWNATSRAHERVVQARGVASIRHHIPAPSCGADDRCPDVVVWSSDRRSDHRLGLVRHDAIDSTTAPIAISAAQAAAIPIRNTARG